MPLASHIDVIDEATPALRVVPKHLGAELAKRLPKAGQIVANFWKRELSGPATARRLGVGTGALRNSIRWARRGPTAVVVGTHLPYAMAHEFGLRRLVRVRSHLRLGRPVSAHTRRSNLRERPHRAPALKRARRPLETLFAVGVEEALAMAAKDGRRLARAQKRLAGRLGPAARRTRG